MLTYVKSHLFPASVSSARQERGVLWEPLVPLSPLGFRLSLWCGYNVQPRLISLLALPFSHWSFRFSYWSFIIPTGPSPSLLVLPRWSFALPTCLSDSRIGDMRSRSLAEQSMGGKWKISLCLTAIDNEWLVQISELFWKNLTDGRQELNPPNNKNEL